MALEAITIIREAEKQAENIVIEAHQEARKILKDAGLQCERLLENAVLDGENQARLLLITAENAAKEDSQSTREKNQNSDAEAIEHAQNRLDAVAQFLVERIVMQWQ